MSVALNHKQLTSVTSSNYIRTVFVIYSQPTSFDSYKLCYALSPVTITSKYSLQINCHAFIGAIRNVDPIGSYRGYAIAIEVEAGDSLT